MGTEMLELFVERVKREIHIHKFVKEDVIMKLITCFEKECKKMDYSKKIKNPLEMVLDFYKDYNQQYYNMIIKGLKSGRIVFDSNLETSFTDTNSNTTFLKPLGNDGDVFRLVHEMAHFIDRNSNPFIVPNEYSFLCEVYSFYIEKRFEFWLSKQGYKELIQARRNNRIYFEAKMMRAIKYEMDCEAKYQKFGTIDLSSLDRDMVNQIMDYHYGTETSFINYVLRYPLGNILSDYLIDIDLKNDYDICEVCLSTNLYEILDTTSYCKIN